MGERAGGPVSTPGQVRRCLPRLRLLWLLLPEDWRHAFLLEELLEEEEEDHRHLVQDELEVEALHELQEMVEHRVLELHFGQQLAEEEIRQLAELHFGQQAESALFWFFVWFNRRMTMMMSTSATTTTGNSRATATNHPNRPFRSAKSFGLNSIKKSELSSARHMFGLDASGG